MRFVSLFLICLSNFAVAQEYTPKDTGTDPGIRYLERVVLPEKPSCYPSEAGDKTSSKVYFSPFGGLLAVWFCNEKDKDKFKAEWLGIPSYSMVTGTQYFDSKGKVDILWGIHRKIDHSKYYMETEAQVLIEAHKPKVTYTRPTIVNKN